MNIVVGAVFAHNPDSQTSELYWDTTAGINQMDANCRQHKLLPILPD